MGGLRPEQRQAVLQSAQALLQLLGGAAHSATASTPLGIGEASSGRLCTRVSATAAVLLRIERECLTLRPCLLFHCTSPPANQHRRPAAAAPRRRRALPAAGAAEGGAAPKQRAARAEHRRHGPDKVSGCEHACVSSRGMQGQWVLHVACQKSCTHMHTHAHVHAPNTTTRRLELTVDQSWPPGVLGSLGRLQALRHLSVLKLDCGRQQPPEEMWHGARGR
jgi:hypothetical protein